MRVVNLTGANQALSAPVGPFLYYRGITVRETAGAVAVLRVYDGTSAAGTVLDDVSLVANESAREVYDHPKIATIGVYVQIVSGTIEGSVCID